eukprot:9095320-Heterocapsa_arctica.AAC.1
MDNFGGVNCLARGRSQNYALLQQCRRSCALQIAGNMYPAFRWTASELNESSDEASRRFMWTARQPLLAPIAPSYD